MNANTAFIDASQIYGSNANRARNLRQLSMGRMKSNSQLTGFLPATQQVDSSQVRSVGQFIAGDDRINENPALTAIHNGKELAKAKTFEGQHVTCLQSASNIQFS